MLNYWPNLLILFEKFFTTMYAAVQVFTTFDVSVILFWKFIFRKQSQRILLSTGSLLQQHPY